jgi:threonylcarbamoyladenosine tRNA methylthiotransferase MtaB
MSKKVAFYTLGCKLNYSETSTISRKFEEKGFQKVDFTDKPDIFIINTCSVTENADKKCHKIVREARAISPDAYIAIVGCYAQLKPKEISEIPGVDAVLGAAEKFMLVDLLDGFVRKPQPTVLASDIAKAGTFNTSFSMNDRTRTFLKVQDGCDYSCSFCTIPLARGSSRSDSVSHVVDTARSIAAKDVKEIVLTGVNTGDFGIQDGERKERFIDLIQALDQVEGIDRFRISSIEPNLLTDEIIDFVASSAKFVPHFHIPLQSGSNKILKLMRRRYQRELYVSRVEKIKAVMPDACIGVDVIVGFPGETKDDFLETYHFLNELNISYLHVFTYSEREKTTAASMAGRVPNAERHERSKMLHILSDKKRRAFYETQLGKDWSVLFEIESENGKMFGFTENYLKVAANYDPLRVNEIIPVRITGITEDGLALVEELQQEAVLHH